MKTIISTNPGKNYKKVGEVEITSHQDISRKVQQAHEAKEAWRRIGIAKRIEYMRKAYAAFRNLAGEIAEVITKEVGTPITKCKDEIDWDWGYFEWFLDNAEKILKPEITSEDKTGMYKVVYEPIGVAAVITPWNLPFDLFLWGVIPNLLVGNTVVYKASAECALSGKLFEEIMDTVNLPKGVFAAIHGTSDQGEFLANQDLDLIWFTGSSEVGKKLYELSGKKFIKSIMEMGGSNPAIVLADADINLVVEKVLSKRYSYSGQACDAVKRLIVHKSIFDEVVNRLTEKVHALKVADPEDPHTQIGPLVSKKQLETLMKQVDDSVKLGANIVTGGKQPENVQGAYYLPTILTNITRDMPVWKEEVFGPVLPVIACSTEQEAIALANDTQYGLGSQVYTKDIKKALQIAEEMKAGSVDINGVNHFQPFNPFGGYKDSGMGREHGKYGFQELCQIKIISQPK